MKTLYTNIFIFISILISLVDINAQRKYSEIYEDMPNMSLDQMYSELMQFQKQNPYFANTYIQLGIVCEHKMALTDPLRDIESAVFWAENAHLFFGNFLVFYQSGDYRSNSEYYENLNIPHSGSKITEEDIKEFVALHEKKCKNFRDSTLMIYTAIEKSKAGYNKSIQAYINLCEQFVNYNEMLLAYAPSVEAKLSELEKGISECETEFKEYKRLTKSFPILNYRQLYDKKEIETYRFDGLTYSDFYENRFTIWNFKKWADDYRNELNNNILPLRKEIEKINTTYQIGKSELEKKAPLSVALTAPYDELFLFRLGKYDNNSLVRELFAYLEQRRNTITLAADSLILNTSADETLMNRKMRHIYKFIVQKKQSLQQLQQFSQTISTERINRFSDFFAKNYGGEKGLKTYQTNEKFFLDNMQTDVLKNFASYCSAIDNARKQPSFSNKGRAAALPTWSVSDYEVGQVTGNYITQKVVYDNYGRPKYVAGVKKSDLKSPFIAYIDEQNTTSWIVDIKGANNIISLHATADGCIVCTNVKNIPKAIYFTQKGKEILRSDLSSENVAGIAYNEITKTTYSTFNNADGVTFSLTDSLGNNISNLQLVNIDKIKQVQHVTEGALIFGIQKGNVVVQRIPDVGVMPEATIIKGEQLKIVNIFRASASEICIFMSDLGEKNLIALIDENGKLIDE